MRSAIPSFFLSGMGRGSGGIFFPPLSQRKHRLMLSSEASRPRALANADQKLARDEEKPEKTKKSGGD